MLRSVRRARWMLLAVILATSAPVAAQQDLSPQGRPTFGSVTITNSLKPPSGTTLPATCTPPEVFFDTDAPAGQNWYGCTATNTWTLQGDGGGGGGGDITDVGSCPTGACFQSVTANQVLAAPDGSAGQVGPRALVANDIPGLPASKVTSGQLAPARGGTGQDTSGGTGTARVDAGTWSVGHLKAEGSTVAGLGTATAGLVKRLTDGGATGALVIGDGTTYECDAAKSQQVIISTCPPHNLKGDDSTDETSALQAFLDANKTSTKPIVFPPGKTFRISATPRIRGWDGGRLIGYGAKLRWVGASDPTCDQASGQPECSAFFKLEASKNVTLEGFEFLPAGGGAKPGYGVYISSYQPLITVAAPQTSDTRIDVTFNPNNRRGYAASGTAYIAGTDDFSYTSIGTTAGACGGVGPYCFLGVSGISTNYGATQQIWFMENPKTPSNNVLRTITVNGAAAVAGFQFGDNGYDYGCNTGNDDPWNVDANWGYNLATAGTLPLWGFRQQGVTSAGTMLEDSSRLAGSDADHNLGCGNAVTIRGQEFGGNTATNGAFYITGHVGSVILDATGDAELNEPLLKKAAGTTSEVTILGARLRPGASAPSGMRFIDWSGEGLLTMIGVAMSGRGGTQTPDVIYVTTGGNATTFVEHGVVSSGIYYDVSQNVRWTRTGDQSYQQATGVGTGERYRWNRLNTLRYGSGGHACFEWRDRNADDNLDRTGLWRICHSGTSADGYAYIQGAVPKYGLTVAEAIDTAETQIDVSADPATYGFAASGSAVIGGLEKGYWVTFDYTSLDTSCGGPAGCFKGVSNVSGYAPTGAPVVAEWSQQATAGIIQEWRATKSVFNQDVELAAAKRVTLASDGALWWSTDLAMVRDAANILAQRNGTSGQTHRLYGTYTDASNYQRLSLEWDGSRGFVIETEGAGTGSQQPLYLNANVMRFQIAGGGTPWWCLNAPGDSCWWNIAASGADIIPANASQNKIGSATKTIDAIYVDDVHYPITGRPVKVWLPAAGCNNATAGTIWDLGATAPTPTCVGSNAPKGVLRFPDSDGDYAAFTHLALPADFLASAALDARIVWKTSSSTTSHSVTWQVATICVADDEAFDPAFNAPSTVTADAKAAADDVIVTALTGITKTGCAAGELMHVKVLRNRTEASDDLVGTVDLVGVELTYRRTQ